MGRVQELKRHYFSFHQGVLLECPHHGCSKRLARGDKMKEHYDKKHGINSEDQEDEYMLDEAY